MSEPRPTGLLVKTEEAGARVEARAWGWRHGGRHAWALDSIDLDIAPGERVLILGPSGSGKSTLLAGLAGILGGEDEGEARGSLSVDGMPPEQQRSRIGLVMQDPEAQVVLARVGDDVAFPMENLSVPREQIWPRVGQALEEVGLGLPFDHPTSALSGGQKQRLALAAILAMRPGLLILDEPTANLDPVGVAEVRDAVEGVLAASGATLVVVEHRVDVWAGLVDRIIVILGGRIAADGPVDRILAEQGSLLKEQGIWLPGDDVAAAVGAPEKRRHETSPSDPILSVRGLTIGYDPEHPIRTGINLDIARGQSTCIIGPNGTGKSTLGLTLAGLLPALDGNVSAVPRNPVRSASADPHQWRSADLLGRISMVFQEPEYQFLARSVREELEIGPRQAGMSEDELAPLVEEHLKALGLSALAEANPMTLSGGEKRRLSVASALISAPELLILDEPTFGQDRGTWIELVRLLRDARDRGTTLVSITHDPAYVAAMGDTVIDLSDIGAPGRAGNTGTAQSAGSTGNSGSVGTSRSAGNAGNSRSTENLGGTEGAKNNSRGGSENGGVNRTNPTGENRTWSENEGLRETASPRQSATRNDSPTLSGGGTRNDPLALSENADRTENGPSNENEAASFAQVRSAAEHKAPSTRLDAPSRRRRLLNRVNPVTQVLALIVMTTPLLITIDPISAGIALGLEILLLPLAQIRPTTLALRMIPLLIAAPIAALSMLLYANPGGEIFWSLGPAIISERSIRLALGILVRVLAVGAPAIILLSKIDPTDMADGLSQVLHMPARPVLATLAAARMTGLMAADWKALEQARRIRGIGDARVVVSALRGSFSLLVFALRRSAKLSLTMEARGFGTARTRTWARPSHVGMADAVMMLVALIIPTAALTASVLSGSFELIGR